MDELSPDRSECSCRDRSYRAVRGTIPRQRSSPAVVVRSKTNVSFLDRVGDVVQNRRIVRFHHELRRAVKRHTKHRRGGITYYTTRSEAKRQNGPELYIGTEIQLTHFSIGGLTWDSIRFLNRQRRRGYEEPSDDEATGEYSAITRD